MKHSLLLGSVLSTVFLLGVSAQAHDEAKSAANTVTMNLISPTGVGASVGTVALQDSRYGLLITPNLTQMTPGTHGFHIHQNPDCGPGTKDGQAKAGIAAGDHLAPASKAHEGPYHEGHLGDLPALTADAEGKVTQPVLAPRLKVKDVVGHSLMIHAGGDNYADAPKPLGGGGDRVACGVVK